MAIYLIPKKFLSCIIRKSDIITVFFTKSMQKAFFYFVLYIVNAFTKSLGGFHIHEIE